MRSIHALNGSGPRESRDRMAYADLNAEQQAQVDQLDRLQESVYRPVDWQEMGRLTVDWLTLLREGSGAAIDIAGAFLPMPGMVRDLAKLMVGEKGADSDHMGVIEGLRREVHEYHRDQLVGMEQFERGFREAIKSVLGENGRLIVFVDDLDRCLPEKALEVLEAIKLFLEAPGTVFVLGMDREVIRRGLNARYGEIFRNEPSTDGELPISGDTYLQKIVQIPFQLPPLGIDDVGKFIDHLEEELPDRDRLLAETRDVFAHGLYPNPRQVKRALNIFRLLKEIALARQTSGSLSQDCIAWPLLAKTVVIQTQFPELYRIWRRFPTLVLRLEEAYASRPSDEEEMLRSAPHQMPHVLQPRREAKSEAEGNVEADERAGAQAEPAAGSILAPYLEDRLTYGLLEQMLRYPESEPSDEPLRRSRFSGLARDQIYQYISLAGTTSGGEGDVDLPEAPRELLEQLLSGDDAVVLDALVQVEEREPNVQEAMRRALLPALTDLKQSPKVRAGAGLALGRLGDPRPGVALDENGHSRYRVGDC